jgi:putative nucleotidyltransferase with HDIG domain
MWTISKHKTWEELSKFSWVSDMHGVPQSPVHHAEGDVATHTQMVLRELEGLTEYKELPDDLKEMVWASALMHDIEKRSTTSTDESGNIVSPSHAKKGAFTVRQILYREIETPFEIRESIVGLVRYHGLPLWIFEKPDPVKALLKASFEVDMQLLVMLAKADILGRICRDRNEMLYRIDMFKELCIEQNCWVKTKEFPGDLSKFLYFRKEEKALIMSLLIQPSRK